MQIVVPCFSKKKQRKTYRLDVTVSSVFSRFIEPSCRHLSRRRLYLCKTRTWLIWCYQCEHVFSLANIHITNIFIFHLVSWLAGDYAIHWPILDLQLTYFIYLNLLQVTATSFSIKTRKKKDSILYKLQSYKLFYKQKSFQMYICLVWAVKFCV